MNITEHETGMAFQRSTTTTEIVVDGLHPFYLYNCSVGAVTVEEGPHTAIIAVLTGEAGKVATSVYF